MRDIVLQVFAISLDGVIQTDGSAFESFIAEIADDPVHDRWIVDSIEHADVHAVGRLTYQSMAAYFPNVSHDDGENPMTTSAIDDAMNRMPKVVFARTPIEADWGPVTVLTGDTGEEVERLRRGGDGYVLVQGGATFARALVELDVVDEFRLALCPFVAGSGPRLFERAPESLTLRLVSSQAFANGILQLTYRRSR